MVQELRGKLKAGSHAVVIVDLSAHIYMNNLSGAITLLAGCLPLTDISFHFQGHDLFLDKSRRMRTKRKHTRCWIELSVPDGD